MELSDDVNGLYGLNTSQQLEAFRSDPSLILQVIDAWYTLSHSIDYGEDVQGMTCKDATLLLGLSQILERWAWQQGMNPIREISSAANVCLNYVNPNPNPIVTNPTVQDVIHAFETATLRYHEIREHALHVSRTVREKADSKDKIPSIRNYILSVNPDPWPKLIPQFIGQFDKYLQYSKLQFLEQQNEIGRQEQNFHDPTYGEKAFNRCGEINEYRVNTIELGKMLALELRDKGHDFGQLVNFLNLLDGWGGYNEIVAAWKLLLPVLQNLYLIPAREGAADSKDKTPTRANGQKVPLKLSRNDAATHYIKLMKKDSCVRTHSQALNRIDYHFKKQKGGLFSGMPLIEKNIEAAAVQDAKAEAKKKDTKTLKSRKKSSAIAEHPKHKF